VRITLNGDPFELTPELVRARLDGQVPESIRYYWVEIDGTRWPVKQVISLATGVTNRRRFQSQSSRRWLQKLGFTIGSGASATPVVASSTSYEPGTHSDDARAPALGATAHRPQADVLLIGCVKTKRDHGAPARGFYVSDYFSKMRAHAEATGLPWFILSAEHGLVHPDDWLEPYERYLPNTTRDYRQVWGQKTVTQLEEAVGPLAGLAIEMHAGAAYVEAPLRARGAQIVDDLRGLSIGRRLSWYLHHDAHRGQAVATAPDVVSQLSDPAQAQPLSEVLATSGAGLRMPGLYSWWVDEVGAADLTAGLGHPVNAGLIYAGLAGATRSGGSTSSNTLWGRIATMHLGTKHEFSTLRRSLGSILAYASGHPAIDEVQLTRWMHAHLRVVTIPVADADTLDALESAILTELDPPLNLAKVAKTPLRRQLSALRKQYSGAAEKDRGVE